MKYRTYAGKVGQIVETIESTNDKGALVQAARQKGVRVVIRIDNGKETKIFEDWDRPLGLSHPIFSSIS